MLTPVAVRPALSYAVAVSLIVSGMPSAPSAYSETPPEIFSPLLSSEPLKPVIPGTGDNSADLEKTAELLSNHELFFEPSPLSEPDSSFTMMSSVSSVSRPPKVEVQGYNSLGKQSPLVGYVTLVPADRNHFSYRYDIGAASGSAVDVLLTRESDPLDLTDGFQIGLRRENSVSSSEGLETMRLIFIDAEGAEISRTIQLTGTEVLHELDLSEESFDASQVTTIILRQSFSDLAPDKVISDRRGEIFVSLEELQGGAATGLPLSGQLLTDDYESGSPAGTQQMQWQGTNSGQGSIPGYIRGQDAAEGYAFRYDVGGSPGAEVKAVIFPEEEPYIPAPEAMIYLAVKNTHGGDVRIGLTDEAGNTAEYTLDLTTAEQLFMIDLTDPFYHEGSFDGQKIQKMEVLTDRNLSPDRRGEINLRFMREKVDPFLSLKPVISSTAVNSAAQAVIHFNAVQDAVVYQLQAASDPGFTNIVHEGFPSQSPERLTFQEEGIYYVRLRASAHAQIETGPVTQWSETAAVDIPADTFTPSKPLIGSVSAVTANNAEVQFGLLADAAIYEVQVSTDPDFTALHHSGFPVEGSEIFQMPAEDVFYVRVRGSIQQDVNLGPVSQWSDVYTYDKNAVFSQLKPVVSSVEPNFSEDEAAIHFAGVSGADYYEYEVSSNQQFSPVTVQAAVNASPAVAEISPGNYFVRVRAALDETGTPDTFSQWSTPLAFTITAPDAGMIPNAQAQDMVVLPLGSAGPAQAASLGLIEGEAFNSALTTARGVQILYNTAAAGWQGGGFQFDNFSTPNVKESADLRQLQHLVFGISGTEPEVKLEVIDASGNSAFVRLSGITETENFWKIPAAEFAGVNFAKISFIYFIVEGNGKEGRLAVNHLPSGFPLSSSANLTLSDLPNYPAGTAGPLRPAAIGPAAGTSTVMAAERGIHLDYATGTHGWAAGGFAYDNFGSPTIETGNISLLNRLVFGLKGGAPEVKVEISDLQGRKVAFKIQGIEAGVEKYWQIPTALLDAVDLNSITLILFIVEGEQLQGRLTVNHLKVPQLILPSETLVPADLLAFPAGAIGAPVEASIGPLGSVNSAAATPRGVLVQYGTGEPGWAGGGLSYDNFSTQALENADLSALQALTFGIKGTSGTLKFELIDSDGGKFSIPIKGISASEEKVFRIPVSLITGVNLSKVRLMYFIVEGPSKSGTFEVNHLPPPFELLPSAALTPSDIVDFTEQEQGTHGPTAVAPQGAVSTVTSLARGIRIDFETRDPGWAGGGISFDNFSTPAVESGDLSALTQVTFGLKGSVPKVKLEVIDADGNKSTVTIAGILPDQEKVWVLPLTLLPEVDLTRIRLIYLIVEGGNQTGNIEIYNRPV